MILTYGYMLFGCATSTSLQICCVVCVLVIRLSSGFVLSCIWKGLCLCLQLISLKLTASIGLKFVTVLLTLFREV